jgi:Flp pilus assembly protein TadB
MTAVNWPLIGGLGALFVALFLLVVTVSGSLVRSGRDRDLVGRIARYGPRHGTGRATDDPGSAKRTDSVAIDVTKRLMGPAAEQRLSGRLELAAVARKPAEWVLLGGCAAVVIAAVLSLLTGNLIIGVLAGSLLGWLGMRMLLNYLIRRRRAAFAEQLPDLLQLLASSLQSGFSLPQAIDAVVSQTGQPAGPEFARALAETRLGATLEDCLETVADRMGSEDLRWTVMAIRIQRGIGGNLAEVLTTTVNTIRERGYLRRQVHALSAEGRLSSYVLIALPIFVGAILFIFESTYMRPLYTTGVGELMLAGAFVLQVVGTLLMRQMIKIEV